VSRTIQTLLLYLRGRVDVPAGTTDTELLERFAHDGDGAAFAALVERHGPMVLGVCKRVLQDVHDAEDAFQAAFLVLAKKARTLGRGDPVGAWLYGVAWRTAVHARADRTRRRMLERKAKLMPLSDTTPAIIWEDLRPVLDEEVQRLAAKYRDPVVLCYLERKTYAEAAREIGCTKGTLATRLAKARRILTRRLDERGLSLPAAGLAALLAENAQATLPPALVHSTVEAATTSVAKPAVAELTSQALTTMSASKLKLLSTVLAAGFLLAIGVGLAFRPVAGEPANPGGSPPPSKTSVAADLPWGEPDAGVQVRIRPRKARWVVGETVTFDVDVRNRGNEARQVYPPVCLWPLWEVEVNGTWHGRKSDLGPGVIEESLPKHLLETTKIKPLEAGAEVKDWGVLLLDGVWLRGVRGDKRIRSEEPEKGLVLPVGKHKIRVAYHHRNGFCPVSNAVEVEVVARDGKDNRGWIQVRTEAEKKTFAYRPDGTGRREVPNAVAAGAIASPDGGSILYVVTDNNQSAVYVADADGKNSRPLSPAGLVASGPTWSLDGKQVAFVGTIGGLPQIHVMDRDGKNVRRVTEADSAPHGAELPKFGAGDRLAYLVFGERVGKRQPADLVIGEGKQAKAIVKGNVITVYAWAHDGTAVAYSRPGEIVFYDVVTGKEQVVALNRIDERLAGHAAMHLCWSPDCRGVACTLVFWGDLRAEISSNGGQTQNKSFGDGEVFVIPRAGNAAWFPTGGRVRDLEWILNRPELTGPLPGPIAPEKGMAIGTWSEPVEGLRGRLLVGQGRDLPGQKARETLVYVELENVAHTHSGERALYFDPGALRCNLTNAEGKAVPEYPFGGSGARGGPSPGWVTIPFDALIRLRANPSGYGSSDGLHIALSNAHFLIKTGDTGEYGLTGTLTIAPPDGNGRVDAWAGTLKLAPVKLRAPARVRPALTDAESGITVAVQDDGRTIVARNRDGTTLWEADVIKTANMKFVGAIVVRDLQLKNRKLKAVFGIHSFADFDLTTGKFLGAGSD